LSDRANANGSFGPDEIKVMTEAYEAALVDLAIADREEPITELIAKHCERYGHRGTERSAGQRTRDQRTRIRPKAA
jgi:Fic family protein